MSKEPTRNRLTTSQELEVLRVTWHLQLKQVIDLRDQRILVDWFHETLQTARQVPRIHRDWFGSGPLQRIRVRPRSLNGGSNGSRLGRDSD